MDDDRPSAPSELTPTARHVAALARREGIAYRPTWADAWAATVARLLGDAVTPDATDDLLVALTRAGKLTRAELVALTMAHHRELRQRA